jgi:hypothetical protein
MTGSLAGSGPNRAPGTAGVRMSARAAATDAAMTSRRCATQLSLALLSVVVLSLSGCNSDPGAGDAAGDSGAPFDSGASDAALLPDTPVPVDGTPPDSTVQGSDAAGAISATMNDVSILFPLPSSEAEIADLLGASSSGARGTLIPSALYSIVGPISGSTNVDAGPEGPAGVENVSAYSDLHVVAIRIDPCFASLSPDPHGVGCAAQIRLIFQEVLPAAGESFAGTGSGTATFDSAVHAFYSLTRDELLALARALVALRVANETGVSLGPLAPHPIMVSQGLGGAMAKGVEQLILQYAGEQNLTRLTQLSNGAEPLTGTDQPGLWFMSGIDVSDAGASSSLAIPTLADDAGSTALEQVNAVLPGPGESFFGFFVPNTASPDDLLPLDNGAPTSLGASDRTAAFASLVRIENPADNSPNTIDCGSCHFATPTEVFVAMPVFSLDDTTSALAFQPDGKSVVAADLAPTFGASTIQLNIHAFSYVGQSPAINQRVVNETAAIVEYLNDLPE